MMKTWTTPNTPKNIFIQICKENGRTNDWVSLNVLSDDCYYPAYENDSKFVMNFCREGGGG